MKTMKFFAAALVAAVVAASCSEPSGYEKRVADAKADSDVVALCPSSELVDSVSYLLGVNYGLMFKGNGFAEDLNGLNVDELLKGMEDALSAGEPTNMYGVDTVWTKNFKVSPYDMNKVLNGFIQARMAYKAKLNAKIGENFLAENATKNDVQTSASGLQYILHDAGEGDRVSSQDTVVVNYKGTLLNGKEFDANESAEFVANRVIKGWTEGLALLGQGGKATFFIPADLAYGERGTRGIDPNSTLVFEVEVLEVRKYQAPVVE